MEQILACILNDKAGSNSAAEAQALIIRLSRIYLGVHYPSDVLGGYLVAIAWLAIVLLAEKWLRSWPRNGN